MIFLALMSIWLGPVPTDFKLKDALLGEKPPQENMKRELLGGK